MRYYGWQRDDGGYKYYSVEVFRNSEWKVGIWDNSRAIYVYSDPLDPSSLRKVFLRDELFVDYLKPTEAERALFELEFGFPYIDKEFLENSDEV